jgi:hypothetical protein
LTDHIQRRRHACKREGGSIAAPVKSQNLEYLNGRVDLLTKDMEKEWYYGERKCNKNSIYSVNIARRR